MTDTGSRPQAGFWKRNAGRLAAMVSMAALAGCQVVPKPDRTPPPPAAAAPTPDVLTPLPSDAQRHRVALLVPMTGANAGVGRSISNATIMAQFDTRTEKVRITTYDTGAGVAPAVKKALAEGNRLILGPLTADEVRVAAPLARAAKVPMLSFSNDVSVAGQGVYLMGYVPAQSIERVVGYATGRGVTNFAALVPKGLYGERAGNAVLAAVRAKGGNVVALESFDRTPASMAAAVKKLGESSSYDALLIADVARVAVQIAPLVRTGSGAKARLLGTELWNTDETVRTSVPLRGAWYASVSDDLYRTFSTKYRTRYKAAPYRLASLGYDAVLLTVRIADTWKVGDAFPAARLTDKEGFGGLDGVFRFSGNGIVERALEVSEVEAGTLKVVDPAPVEFPK